MDLIITIISEKHSPTLTVRMDNEESALFALHLINVFADEVSLEEGLIMRGRTYQQKTSEFISNLRMFIENHGSKKELWLLYDIMAALSDGEYYAVITQAINEGDLNAIKENLLHLNHPDYDELMKFKAEYCIGVIDNYDVVHYYNGKDLIKIGEADKSKRKCRFCGRMMPEVSYKKIAHTISEGLGNKCIITNDECDNCNETLGKEIEQDLITYLSPLRTFMSINGKNGKGKIKDDSFALYEEGPKSMKIDLFEKESPEEKHWKFEKDGDIFKLSFTHPQMVNPQDVYRAVVKYAIGVMNEAQLPYFEETIKWIKKERSATDLPQLCFFLDQHPGREGKPCITVFTRKNRDMSLPYSYVEIQVAGVVIFAIIPFCNQDDRSFAKKEDWTHTMNVLKIYNKMPILKSIAPNKDKTERITYIFDFKKRSEVE